MITFLSYFFYALDHPITSTHQNSLRTSIHSHSPLLNLSRVVEAIDVSSNSTSNPPPTSYIFLCYSLQSLWLGAECCCTGDANPSLPLLVWLVRRRRDIPLKSISSGWQTGSSWRLIVWLIWYLSPFPSFFFHFFIISFPLYLSSHSIPLFVIYLSLFSLFFFSNNFAIINIVWLNSTFSLYTVGGWLLRFSFKNIIKCLAKALSLIFYVQ